MVSIFAFPLRLIRYLSSGMQEKNLTGISRNPDGAMLSHDLLLVV